MPRLETASAGLNHDAEEAVTSELVEWADVILVMERAHRVKLQRRFGRWLKGKRVVCLDIPDDYAFMQPELVAAGAAGGAFSVLLSRRPVSSPSLCDGEGDHPGDSARMVEGARPAFRASDPPGPDLRICGAPPA